MARIVQSHCEGVEVSVLADTSPKRCLSFATAARADDYLLARMLLVFSFLLSRYGAGRGVDGQAVVRWLQGEAGVPPEFYLAQQQI